jgi:superfamily I DNA/RNA helicase
MPHYHSLDSDQQLEEERRLLYVAMTRARQSLLLTHAARRGRWGKMNCAEPSRFLDALPAAYHFDLRHDGRGRGRQGRRRRGHLSSAGAADGYWL